LKPTPVGEVECPRRRLRTGTNLTVHDWPALANRNFN